MIPLISPPELVRVTLEGSDWAAFPKVVVHKVAACAEKVPTASDAKIQKAVFIFKASIGLFFNKKCQIHIGRHPFMGNELEIRGSLSLSYNQ
ncbi:hypothetical protein [Akkermansia muciniphila]|uniref:hypothetical protein n=1 Tax=Akkermansia muciniphila TaxID=239935 RepID=UPI000C9B0AE9|nr:hypothetical protein [Akkermansia muciniphila]